MQLGLRPNLRMGGLKMYNGELITELNEHGQYSSLLFNIDGQMMKLSNLESIVKDNTEYVIFNFEKI